VARSGRSSLPRHRPPAALAVGFLLLAAAPAGAFNDGLGEPPKELDRSSPYATAQGFLAEARQGHLAASAHDLWLDNLPKDRQATEGARLARRLRFVLDRHALELESLPKEGEGGPGSVTLTTLALDGRPTPIRLVRIRTEAGPVWVFGRDTVRDIDDLYEEYGPPFGERMPAFLFTTRFGLELWQWLGLLLAAASALLVGWLGEKVLLAIGRRIAALTSAGWDDELVRALRGPLKLPLWIATFGLIQVRLLLPPEWDRILGRLSGSLGIIAVTWLVLRCLDVAAAGLNRRLVARGPGVAAGARTQVSVLWRLMTFAVYFLGLAALLMQFDVVRTVGVSLLASAGVLGVVVGLAAQKSIGAVFAGIQLSITQPIRIGDRVTVEGETGVVTEIALSYVAVRLWDNRQMVLPVSYFLEKPFQNWSRESSDLLGSVLLQLDYRVDVAQVRAELDRILEGSGKPLWNARVAKVQVTDSSEATATVRLLVSAADPETLFDLRCVVREEFLAFLRAHPDWLPTSRVEQTPAVRETSRGAP
jgi:small-conductance mechanosensitive channel